MSDMPIPRDETIWLDNQAERDFFVMLDVYQKCIRKAVDNEVFNLDDTVLARRLLDSFVTVLRHQQAEIQLLKAIKDANTTPTLTPQPSQVTINPEERERG